MVFVFVFITLSYLTIYIICDVKNTLTLCPDFTLRHRPKHVLKFCYQTKDGGAHVSLFPFVSSPWRNCPKNDGHHFIEMLHLNFSEMLFIIK